MSRHIQSIRQPKTYRGGSLTAAPSPAPTQKLSTRHRRWIYFSIAALWISGGVWLIAHYFLRDPDDLAALIHPSEPWSMKIHGALVMLFFVVIGSLAATHVRVGWRRKQNRGAAVLLSILLGVLALSGYLLYYASGEALRGWMSVCHWVLGLALPAVTALHVYLGRKLRKVGSR